MQEEEVLPFSIKFYVCTDIKILADKLIIFNLWLMAMNILILKFYAILCKYI